jgi:hypothetical protein
MLSRDYVPDDNEQEKNPENTRAAPLGHSAAWEEALRRFSSVHRQLSPPPLNITKRGPSKPAPVARGTDMRSPELQPPLRRDNSDTAESTETSVPSIESSEKRAIRAMTLATLEGKGKGSSSRGDYSPSVYSRDERGEPYPQPEDRGDRERTKFLPWMK